MKIKLTEKQIRLIIQEAFVPKEDVKNFLKLDNEKDFLVRRPNEIKKSLNNIFDKLREKSIPELNNDPDRLYFRFSEDDVLNILLNRIKKILIKINDYNQKNKINIEYYIDYNLFKDNQLEQINKDEIGKFVMKDGQYALDSEGNKRQVKYKYPKKIINILEMYVNKISNFNEKKFSDLRDKLSVYFGNTKNLKIENQNLIVLSKKPYDIVGMSSCKDWTSCMNIYDGIHKEKVKDDIREGTIVAYLIKPDDLEIENPISRSSIKPFISQNDSNDIMYKTEEKVYGQKFSIDKYLNNFILPLINQNKINYPYIKNSKLYNDDSKSVINEPIYDSYNSYDVIHILNKNLNSDKFYEILEEFDDSEIEYLNLYLFDHIDIYRKINTFEPYIENSIYSIKNLQILKENNFNKFQYFLDQLKRERYFFKIVDYYVEENLIKYNDMYEDYIIIYLLNSSNFLKSVFENNYYIQILKNFKNKKSDDLFLSMNIIVNYYNKIKGFDISNTDIFSELINENLLDYYIYKNNTISWLSNFDFKKFFVNNKFSLNYLKDYQIEKIYNNLNGLEKAFFKSKIINLKNNQ